jgi:hypothetical protein
MVSFSYPIPPTNAGGNKMGRKSRPERARDTQFPALSKVWTACPISLANRLRAMVDLTDGRRDFKTSGTFPAEYATHR